MNVAKAIEIALAKLIRNRAELGEGVAIRAWQSLPIDGSLTEEKDRSFPMIDVRCSPPKTDDNESTQSAEVFALCMTKMPDDLNRAFISQMYSAAQDVLDGLFSDFRKGTKNGPFDEFKDFMDSALGDSHTVAIVSVSITWGDGLAPQMSENGINQIGCSIVIHYGRTDF